MEVVKKEVTYERKVRIAKAVIDNVSMEEALEAIDHLVAMRQATQYIVTPNVDHIVKLERDADFAQVYAHAALVLADGRPLLWAAKMLNTPLKEKVSGSDLFPRLAERAVRRGYKLFFLGGRKGAAERAARVLEKQYPGLQVAGVYSPPFGFQRDPQENDRIVAMIKKAQPDILLVGLGAPKQEKWIYQNRQRLGVPVAIGIGVSFEFIAGVVKRAPVWMQRSGLEWLWRLLNEPRRLWRRYLIEDMQFFGMLWRQMRDCSRHV